ncbi:MAG: hypothetical protein ABI605_13970 [Rhizobacter sp.]
MKLCLACWLFALCSLAHASDEAHQRSELKRQREAIEAKHAEREEACRKQFVVTACLEEARTDKQEALQAVRTQELMLDDAQRRERAQAQAQRVAEKAKAAEEREKPVLRKEPKTLRVPSPKVAKAPSPKASAPDRGQAEKQKREEFEARKREIQAHREAVEKRNAERAARKPPKPLPVPASAGQP